jgi:hypothetical protein
MMGQESGPEDLGAASEFERFVYWMVIGTDGDVEPL